MIAVNKLEEQDKLRTQKTSRRQSQKITEDIKPKKPSKIPYKIPKEAPKAPSKKSTEYRTAILPLAVEHGMRIKQPLRIQLMKNTLK